MDAETGNSVPQGYGSLEGAVYEVSKNGTEVGTITTDKNGKGSLAGLEPGTYQIKEIKASKGYLLNDEIITVEAKIKEANTANFNYTVTAKETPTTVLPFN